eukprot:778288-Pyramimonas_sp.AAC.1
MRACSAARADLIETLREAHRLQHSSTAARKEAKWLRTARRSQAELFSVPVFDCATLRGRFLGEVRAEAATLVLRAGGSKQGANTATQHVDTTNELTGWRHAVLPLPGTTNGSWAQEVDSTEVTTYSQAPQKARQPHTPLRQPTSG